MKRYRKWTKNNFKHLSSIPRSLFIWQQWLNGCHLQLNETDTTCRNSTRDKKISFLYKVSSCEAPVLLGKLFQLGNILKKCFSFHEHGWLNCKKCFNDFENIYEILKFPYLSWNFLISHNFWNFKFSHYLWNLREVLWSNIFM